MPVFHVNASYIGKGGSASDFARYLHREQGDLATQHRRYLTREGHEKEDLIASGHDHLPAWAKGDDHTFWLAAEHAERKNGVVARVVEFSLPRELSPEAQRELADDFREAYLSDHAHSWAIHAPQAKDGSGPQPHLHVMFSPRVNDARDRSPTQHFKRYNATHPDKGGARKDPSWDTKGRLYDIRWGTATLANAALEREGIPLAVTHLSLRAQGIERDPARYQDPDNKQEIAQVQRYRDRLHQGEKPFELELARAAWSQQKQQTGLGDLSREAMVDHVRDQVWRYDRSPRREQQRQHSFARSLVQTRTPVTRARTHTAPREQTRDPAHQLTQALDRFTRSLGRGKKEEAVGGVGLRVKLREEEQEHTHEHDRGMSW